VQYAAILDIGPGADTNGVGVAAQNRVEPNARIFANCNVAYHNGAAGNPNGMMNQLGTKNNLRHVATSAPLAIDLTGVNIITRLNAVSEVGNEDRGENSAC
jgi:hypothetical protein